MIFMDHGTVDENNITLLMVLYWDIPGYYLQYVLLSLYMGVRRGGGGGGGRWVRITPSPKQGHLTFTLESLESIHIYIRIPVARSAKIKVVLH